MNTKRIAILATAVTLIGTQLGATHVFADNSYGMDYTGGELLSNSNVQIEPTLIESLAPLMNVNENVEVSTSSSSAIQTGYLQDYRVGTGAIQCREVKYVTIGKESPITLSDGVSYTLTQGKYAVTVDFKNVEADTEDDSATYAVGIAPGTSILFTGYRIYQDNRCRTAVSGISSLSTRTGTDSKVFVDMIIKVHDKTHLDRPLKLDNLYFGLTDIDRAQSYKILNTNNMLEPSIMYARSAEELQGYDGLYYNMYVADGKYIYSEYDSSGSLDTNEVSNVYTAINRNTQEEGLNIVLGFATGAYNGIEYFAAPESIPVTAQVTYESDSNGVLNGRDIENVVIESNPSGSSTQPNTGYELDYWTANKNVTLMDGRTITAGSRITSSEVMSIVVREDIVLTAIHKTVAPSGDDKEPSGDESSDGASDESVPAVPNTGGNTGSISASIATISIIGVFLGTLIIKLLFLFSHKKIDFRKY